MLESTSLGLPYSGRTTASKQKTPHAKKDKSLTIFERAKNFLSISTNPFFTTPSTIDKTQTQGSNSKVTPRSVILTDSEIQIEKYKTIDLKPLPDNDAPEYKPSLSPKCFGAMCKILGKLVRNEDSLGKEAASNQIKDIVETARDLHNLTPQQLESLKKFENIAREADPS